MSDDVYGTDWSQKSVELIVADYFEMLKLELSGQKFNKSERNRALQALTGRVSGSIENKHRNISAVFEELGLRPITGYKPLRHFQKALTEEVGRVLAAEGQWLLDYASTAPIDESATAFSLEPPPSRLPENKDRSGSLKRLVRKFDPAKRDAQNRTLGKIGEEFAFKFEQNRLLAGGRQDLARKVEWTSEERGDGAGYDIRSFELDGSDRFIEVKTTNGAARTPFYLSENERSFSEERPEFFKLLRLHDFRHKPAGFLLVPPLDEWVRLTPTVYRASF